MSHISNGQHPIRAANADAISAKKVAILLCTLDGERFLAEQLDSIERQSHKNWVVLASDDGSTDQTLAILHRYKERWGDDRLSIFSGPRSGHVANFLSLACNTDHNADYFAFCDQDDIWLDDKIERSLSWFSLLRDEKPAMYCSRTIIVDEHNKTLGYSPLFSRPPSFANALVQSIGGGNTMMFNHLALDLLRRAGPSVKVVSHDWWVYMVVSGSGGHVKYDADPSLRYRQHARNFLGRNTGFKARLTRLRMLMRDRFQLWNDLNIAAIESMSAFMSEENRNLLRLFCEAREGSLVKRLNSLARSKLYRQTRLGNLGLILAVLTNKL